MVSESPAPLVPDEIDIRGFSGFMLNVDRLLASELVALGTPEECWAALMLWCRAWQQHPAASLPNDDRVLAAFSGAGRRWPKIKAMALRGFVLCSDGRLYHKVLAEEVVSAWQKRKVYRSDQERLRKWRETKRASRSETPPGMGDETPSETHGETSSETRFKSVSDGVSDPVSKRVDRDRDRDREEEKSSLSGAKKAPAISESPIHERETEPIVAFGRTMRCDAPVFAGKAFGLNWADYAACAGAAPALSEDRLWACLVEYDRRWSEAGERGTLRRILAFLRNEKPRSPTEQRA